MSASSPFTPAPTSRRRFLRALGVAPLAVAVGSALASCAGRPTAPAAASQDIKFADSGTSADQTRMQSYLSAFQKSTGINTNLIFVSQYYTENVQAMVSAGVPPDVVFVSRNEYEELTPDKRLADLTPYINQDKTQLDAFFPIAVKEWQQGSQQFALPYGFRTLAVVYDSGLFQQSKVELPPYQWTASGWSVTDFAAAAPKMSYPGTASQDPQYGFYVDPVYEVWSAFVQNNGGQIIDDQYKTIMVDQPPAVSALTALAGVLTKAGVTPPNDVTSADNGVNVFSNGNLAMAVTDPSTLPARVQEANFPWGVGVLPGEESNRGTTGTGAGYGLVAGSKNADAAWKLIQYLTSEAIQSQNARVGQWIPSRQAVANAYAPQTENPDIYPQHKRVYVDAITANKVRLQPNMPNWPAVRAALEAGIQGLWTGTATAQEATAQMKKLAQPLLSQSS